MKILSDQPNPQWPAPQPCLRQRAARKPRAVPTAGQPYARFRIASTPRYRDTATGEWKDGDTLHRAGAPITHRRRPLPAHPGDAPKKHEWWLPLLAAELSVTTGTIRKWLHQGRIAGRQETRHPHRWIIHADPGELAELRAHIDRVRGRTTRVHPKFADDTPNHVTPAQSA